MPQDVIPKHILFSSDTAFVIPDREAWNRQEDLYSSDDIVFFTDGSLMNESAGAGIHCPALDLNVSISMGKFVTVFQSEVFGIKTAAKMCLERGLRDRRIIICSDSQAAISSLSKPFVLSNIVKETKVVMNKLSASNSVAIFWVPGHSNIAGNEAADQLARLGSEKPAQGPEPFLPVSKCVGQRVLLKNLERRCKLSWRDASGMVHSKACISAPSGRFTKELLSLQKSAVRMVVAMLTGHGPFAYHLERLGVHRDSTLCRFCEECVETGWHVLSSCPAIWRKRLQHLGFAIGPDSIEPVKELSPLALQRFCAAIRLGY